MTSIIELNFIMCKVIHNNRDLIDLCLNCL